MSLGSLPKKEKLKLNSEHKMTSCQIGTKLFLYVEVNKVKYKTTEGTYLLLRLL